MDTKCVLNHLVRASRDALHMEQTLKGLGYNETPYFHLYGEITEAIYCMLGESTETFDESVTSTTINNMYLTDEHCAQELSEYCKEKQKKTEQEQEKEDEKEEDAFQILYSTRRILDEMAEERGFSIQQLVNLILSEWVIKKMIKAYT